MEEINYLTADMIVWLDETGSDRQSENRKFGYHLQGITPCSYNSRETLSCVAAMSIRGIEDVDIYMKATSMVQSLSLKVWSHSRNHLMGKALDQW